jgi:2,3-bisphosphoglycerate-independent phosphoglycerate mutase
MKKILFVVLDGLGDEPHPDLGGRTPLEAAETPVMDRLVRAGKAGLMYPVGEPIAPESDIAVISILGYHAMDYYTGRGPLEALAVGIEMEDGDLVYRANFATAGEGPEIVDRRVGRGLSSEEAATLAREINEKVELTSHPATFHFESTVGHRGILQFRSKEGRLSGHVGNTDPAYRKEGVLGVAKAEFENVLVTCAPEEGFEDDPGARIGADLTNEFIEKSRRVMEASPVNRRRREAGQLVANLILTRDAGDRLPAFPKIEERFGIRFGCFVEMPVERGIALLTGMDVIELKDLKGEPRADYPEIARLVGEKIGDYDGLYVHLKGPDIPAHDGKPREKLQMIEAADSAFFAPLLETIDIGDVVLAITADHSTSCVLKAHSSHPVPLAIVGGSVGVDGVGAYSEAACAEGALGTIAGEELMPRLVEAARTE